MRWKEGSLIKRNTQSPGIHSNTMKSNYLPYKIFQEESQRLFRFLENYNLNLASVEEGPINVGTHLTYKSSLVAVQLGFEPQERLILVYLIKLKDKQIPTYPTHTYYIDELIGIKSPSLKIPHQRSDAVLTRTGIIQVLSQYATFLRKYGKNILRGDFSEVEGIRRRSS